MNWEFVIIIAYNTIGLIEFIKGFAKEAKGNTWRIVQIVFVFLISLIVTVAPSWVVMGLTALSTSQIGYDMIIETIKGKMKK